MKHNQNRKKYNTATIWEAGGAYTNTGSAIIVTDRDGLPKRAIYIKNHGPLACAEHALIPVEVGDVVITVDRHRDNVKINTEKIIAIDKDKNITLMPTVVKGVHFETAFNIAVEKSYDYHCRRPYYIEQVLSTYTYSSKDKYIYNEPDWDALERDFHKRA